MSLPRSMRRIIALAYVLCTAVGLSVAHTKPRARDLGIAFDGCLGPLNNIMDVQG